MSNVSNLPPLVPVDRPSVADQIFEKLRTQIIDLALAPGVKISEADVAKALGTSRQPVRDAFFRLSKLGLLEIRPQRSTRVSLISVEKVMEARFVRTALEIETVRVACNKITETDILKLRGNVKNQAEAVRTNDRQLFHRLDDEFHREICTISGHPFTWQIISESKSHLDRVRLLSLFFLKEQTLGEHQGLLEALENRDADRAGILMRAHLSRLVKEMERIRSDNTAFFARPDDARAL